VVLIMGGNAAEAHPVGFKWVSKRTKTTPRWWSSIRALTVAPRWPISMRQCGSDTAFLLGVIRYLIENNKIQHEYVRHYTNASLLMRDDYQFEDGCSAAMTKKAPVR
jgi:formate dehydrogenase major subunit/formate dehydrogenase-N alpha subunit